ncbi:dihydropteroate synthase [Oceaniglobus indicus]|uniref:dihydropteroate synthase n=1 Tax=Oceaniglobus indicus TaxID=2047749 RepID=UPI000C17DA62|nr:dihydropteroate synthase [Oceaniglobus indicus]
MSVYYRPVVQCGPRPGRGAWALAGGPCWFNEVEVLSRTEAPQMIAAHDTPAAVLDRLTAPRPAIGGLDMARPNLMGILNTTPDSFSDGGQFHDPAAALAQARRMIAAGADILDIGGESTRPGAEVVPDADEIARTAPVIAAIRAEWGGVMSIDTRKAVVAEAAIAAGAGLINDVSAFRHDPAMAGLAARSGLPVCLMHAQGTPETMQRAPSYGDVTLDVYDMLEGRIAAAEAAGIPRARILIDPGIGFGKTVDHNLALLANLSLFHGLGCAILLGASRKRFIGALSGADDAASRVPGSVAVALAGIAQGVQVVRVHDMAETRQAVTLWQAAMKGQRA